MNRRHLYNFEDFVLDESERRLTRNGNQIHLTPIEIDLLVYFVVHPDTLLSREDLLNAIWQNEIVEINRVDATVSGLREKLGGEREAYIQTVRGTRNRRRGITRTAGGYRFVARVNSEKALEDIECPFPGLQAFDRQYYRFFFGRDAEVHHLLMKLEVSRFLAVIGVSGSGKSSLIRAGVVRALEEQQGSDLDVIVFQPGSEPLRRLATEIAGIISTKASNTDTQAVYQRLQADPIQAIRHMSELLHPRTSNETLIWIIDQFEEVFTQCRSEEERAAFSACIVALASSRDLHQSIIITIQASILSEIMNRSSQVYRQLGTMISNSTVMLHPPSEDALLSMMIEPATLVGLEYEEGLTQIILKDLNGQSGALPLLSHTLLELFERRKGKLLTRSSYIEVGGVEGSIARRADAIYETFGEDARRVIKRVMLRLSQFTYGGIDLGEAKQRILLSDLYSNDQEKRLVDDVVFSLAAARLLTISGDEHTYGAWVEVAHEALIRKWTKLGDWLAENRTGLRILNKLSRDAIEWKEQGENDDRLYRGKLLTEAQDLRDHHGGLLTDVALTEGETAFLDASERLAKREWKQERKRKTAGKYLIVALGGVAVLAVVTILVWQQRDEATRQRDIARSLRLASESYVAFDPEISLLMAMEAVKINATRSTEAALRRALALPIVQASLEGHRGQVISVSPSRNGDRVVTASADKTIRIWNPSDGSQIFVLSGHTDRVNNAVFSPDGRFIVSSSNDKTAIIWDVEDRKPLRILEGNQSIVNNAVFNQNGSLVLTAGGDKTARVWDTKSGKGTLVLTGHLDALNGAAFSPDGKQIATASKDKTANLYLASTGQVLRVLTGHAGSVLNVSFSPDGKRVATCSADRTSRVWDVVSGDLVFELRGHSDNVNSIEFSPEGNWIVTASKDGTARIWRAHDGQFMAELAGHRGGVNSACFSPDEKFVFTASGDGTARVWILNIAQSTVTLVGHSDTVYGSSFSPDGRRVVTASKDGTGRIWDTTNGKEIGRLEHGSAVFSAAYNPTGDLIATAGKNGKIRIWDAATGSLRKELYENDCLINSVAFSRSGKLIVTAGGSDSSCGKKENAARVWDVATAQCLRSFSPHADQVSTAVFDSDSKTVLTASRDGTIKIWSVSSGEQIDEFRIGVGFVNSAAFSPDDKQILAACADNTTRVFDRDHNLIRILRGHDQWVNYAEFSPNGVLVATASGDQSAHIYELDTGAILFQLSEHHASVFGASFSADGRYIATASKDSTVKIYSCRICGAQSQELLELALARTRRALTANERKRFLNQN
jgi:WD40 repeat protein/DNA-binding winged helix-turn-helix (wHTH) protein